MNAGEFTKHRDLIRAARRSNAWRKRALLRLLAEARAVHIDTSRIKLPNGQIVCTWRRYITEQSAVATLVHVEAEHRQPIRAYCCNFCYGWHLTSSLSHFEAK